jgi:lipoprotein-releasing system ATP-binding protein
LAAPVKEAERTSFAPVLVARDLVARRDACAVEDVSLELAPGDFCALRGVEGSGRGLLLRLLGLLERADAGEITVEGRPTAALSHAERDELRNHRFGFIFSAPFLLPSMTVLENVAMPLFRISHLTPEQAHARTDLLLDFVDLRQEAQEPINSLSAHAQQCVSLARALATEPAVIIAEELEGAVMLEERQRFSALLRDAAGRFGVAIVAAVPPEFIGRKGDRLIDLAAGRVVQDSAAYRELGT